MSSASVSPHGFVTVRGRGYHPAQVDAFTAALCRDRDAGWERAARLTVLAREMEAEAGCLRETVARLAPQTYEALGERARRLFRLGQAEAAEVRERARREADERVARARAYADGVRRAAREYAETLRAEAGDRARHRLLAARAEADEVRVAARREVEECRAEAVAALREVRQRTLAVLAGRQEDHVGRWAAAERAAAERAAALEARHAARIARAEAALREAERALADAGEAARLRQEEARARAAGIVAEARLCEERIARETERVLREHGKRRDGVQAHMEHVRACLAALTGEHAPAK
ncbi:cellulose-binding protein [Streptomyces sp. JB150]|uniref:cellulose-binding protein n=1 Tax=Streptomyces sp. JB150 TaxID=2714844 RepID=UPI00140C2A99|nr:cellulose-binding protein [Streptomyces sp. JB150]QIJ63155.1 cellulose-binding protein [Streptomyces sp. JB150]